MKKVFIDTSVILAACKSKSGGSSYIMMLCRKGILKGYISRYVAYEAKVKSDTLLTQQEKVRLNFLILQCNLEITHEPSEKDISKYTQFIERKDAPILASAKAHDIQYLLTLNTRDFMKEKVRKCMHPTLITTPKEMLKREKLLLNARV